MNDFTFQQIRNQAESRWRELWNGQQPVILIGTATCGRATGALEVLRAMRAFLEKENLDFPILEVGCMGEAVDGAAPELRAGRTLPIGAGR